MNCRGHDWVSLIDYSRLTGKERAEFFVDTLGSQIRIVLFCTNCGKTGHAIRSHRGGVQVHYNSDYFIKKAKELEKKFDIDVAKIKTHAKTT